MPPLEYTQAQNQTRDSLKEEPPNVQSLHVSLKRVAPFKERSAVSVMSEMRFSVGAHELRHGARDQ